MHKRASALYRGHAALWLLVDACQRMGQGSTRRGCNPAIHTRACARNGGSMRTSSSGGRWRLAAVAKRGQDCHAPRRLESETLPPQSLGVMVGSASRRVGLGSCEPLHPSPPQPHKTRVLVNARVSIKVRPGCPPGCVQHGVSASLNRSTWMHRQLCAAKN